MNFLLDTNFIIFLLKGDLSAKQLLSLQEAESFYLSSITVSELIHGAFKSKQQEKNLSKVDLIIKNFDILDFNLGAARVFGRLRSNLEKNGTIIGPYDLQIAAIALENSCTLVTRNLKEFTRIDDLKVIGY